MCVRAPAGYSPCSCHHVPGATCQLHAACVACKLVVLIISSNALPLPHFLAYVAAAPVVVVAGTLRCNEENEAFRQHYNYLQEVYTQPAWKREKQQQQQQQQPQQQEEQEQQQRSSWHPSDDAQAQQGQQQGSWWWGWRRQE